MFLLNHNQILEYCQRPIGQKLDIVPLEEDNLQHTSYYFRLGAYYWKRASAQDPPPLLEGDDPYLDQVGELSMAAPFLDMQANEYIVVQTMERFRLDDTLFAIFGNVSHAAHRGIQVVNSLFIDPLFPSQSHSEPLKIGLRNLNPDRVVLRLGDVIGKVAFFDVSDTYPVSLRPGSSHAERFDK